MTSTAKSNELWHRHDDLELSRAKRITHCKHAAEFAQWAQEQIERARENPTAISINQAKLFLLDRYWDWYASVGSRHQKHIGQRNSHTCIFQVFAESYAQLRALELSTTPPPITEPSSAPREPMAQIPGLVLGMEQG